MDVTIRLLVPRALAWHLVGSYAAMQACYRSSFLFRCIHAIASTNYYSKGLVDRKQYSQLILRYIHVPSAGTQS